MSQSAAYLKPKATSRPQVVEYVWASDSNAIIVDLSGTKNSKLNANTASNNLTRLTNDDGSLQDIWSDSTGRLYNLDVSGNDISGSSFPLAFFVADESGLNTLTRVTNSAHKFALPPFNVVDKLFTDASGMPFFESYTKNVLIKNTPTDISLTLVSGSVISTIRDLDFNARDTSNNKVTFDLSGFRMGGTRAANPDISYNPFARYDVSLNLSTKEISSLYSAARTDISNHLMIKLHKFGLGTSNLTFNKYSNSNAQNTTIDISVNILNASGVLKLDTSANGILSAQTSNALLQPNLALSTLLQKKYTFTKSGRQNLSIPITIPAGESASGFWIWNATLVDGNMTAQEIAIQINVQPSFAAPVITLDSMTSSTIAPGLLLPASFNIRVADRSFTGDISNNLTRGLLVYPRINAVNALVPGDVSANYLNKSFIIKKDVSLYEFVANDLSLNTLTFNDISNGTIPRTNLLAHYTQDLVVGVNDVSYNSIDEVYFKLRDVSTNLMIDVSANDHFLPSREFNLYLDWLPNAQPGASTNGVKPQTSNMGTINVATTFSANVNLVENQDGTYSLSLSDNNGPFDSTTSYVIRLFSDEKCSITTSNFTVDPEPNVYGKSGNQFNVQMDSDFKATFNSPKLTVSRVWMVAYMAKSNNVHLYTASRPIRINNIKFPTLSVTIANEVAFSPADLNKIVNITEGLELNTSINDLSGYRITDISGGIDLSCCMLLPSWYPVGSKLTFTLNDNSGVVKSMDISANLVRQPRILPNTSTVFTNLSDVSNNVPFYIDLSFNPVRTSALFTLDIAFSDSNQTMYPLATKTIAFYYPGFGTNKGGNKNTLIVFNDAKYALDAVPGLTQMTLPPKDSFDSYTWTAGSHANTYGLNLARPEFIGNGHVLDASGFRIDAVTQTGVLNADPAALFIQFNGAWSGLTTYHVANTTAVTNATMNAVLPCSFARNTYSWIDTKKFVGTIDIQYTTKDSFGSLSAAVNTLRLVVLPRPAIQASIALNPNVLVNTPSTLQLTVRNFQKNKLGSKIDISGYSPKDISGNRALNGKFRTLLNTTSGSVSLVSASGVADTANSSFFAFPNPVNDMLYNGFSTVPFTFKGRPTAGIVSSNIQANYSMVGSRAISGTTPLQVVVYSTDSTFNNSVYANNLTVNTQLNFAGMPAAQYVALDNSYNTIDLNVDSRTKNAATVVVENKGSVVSAALTASNPTTSLITSANYTNGIYNVSGSSNTVAAGVVAVFTRDIGDTWKLLYTKKV